MPKLPYHNHNIMQGPLTPDAKKDEAVVISIDDSDHDYHLIHANARLIVDTKNAISVGLNIDKVVKA